MKCVILAIFAALLMGLFTATQAEAQGPLGLSETILEEVEANLTMRYDPAGATRWRFPIAPDTVEVTATGTTVATWEMRLALPPEAFGVFWGDTSDDLVPLVKPFQVAIPTQLKRTVGMTYHITIEFGLGPPTVYIVEGRQMWYWGLPREYGGCFWAGCDAYGEGPFPPGDWSTQAAYQSAGPGDPNDPLYGCNSRLMKDGEWVCVEPGWEPR